MAIVSMLGFDNMPQQLAMLFADPSFPVSFPRLTKSPISNKDISLAQVMGTAINQMGYRTGNDPDNNTSIGVLAYGNATQSSTNVVQQMLVGPPISDTTLDKTGKWIFGASVSVPAVIASTGVMAVIGDMDNQAKNIAIAQGNSATAPAVVVTSGSAYYVEFVIDWSAKTVEGWVDGVFIASTTFTTTPIASIGNGVTNQYLPSSGGVTWWNASWSLFTSWNYHLNYNHVYFAINKANETDVTPRLGPVRVRGVAIGSVDAAGDAAPVNATDFPTGVSTPVSLVGVPNVSVRLDSGGGKSAFHFATPVIQANEETITAFQMDVFTFKQRDAAANAVLSFTDGSTSSPDYTLPETEVVRRESLCLSQPYSGGTWTPAKVAAMQVKLSSVPNS